MMIRNIGSITPPFGLVAGVILSLAALMPQVSGQNSGGEIRATSPLRWDIVEVAVEFEAAPADQAARTRLEGEVRKQFRIFPGSRVGDLEITLAVQRVERLPQIEKATYRFEFPAGALSEEAVRLVLHVVVGEAGRAAAMASGIFKSGRLNEFPILYKDSRTLVKLNTNAVGHFASFRNSWLGNGATLGAGFPSLKILRRPPRPRQWKDP